MANLTEGYCARDRQVPAAMEQLIAEITQVREGVKRLGERTQTVLRIEPAAPGCEPKEKESLVALAQLLSVQTNRLASIRQDLLELSARCEL